MRRLLISGGVVAALSLGALLAVVWATREPMCNGVPVRELVELIARGPGPESEVWAVEQLQTEAPVAVTFIVNALNSRTNGARTNLLRDRLNDQWTKLYLKLPPGLRKVAPRPRERFHIDPRNWLVALTEVGPRDERVIPALTNELSHPDSEMRFFATYSLSRIVTNWLEHPTIRSQIIDALRSKLKDQAGNVRGAALVGLGRCGAAAEPHVSELVDRLSDSDESPRMQAMRALVDIGASTNLILPHIEKLVRDTDAGVRAYAAYTHWKLTGEPGTNLLVLRDVLHGHAENYNRSLAAGYLGLLGPQAREAAPDLVRAMADSEFDISLSAAKALWRVTGETNRTVLLFKKALAEGQSHYRSYSAEALKIMGASAEPALPELIDALAAKEYLVRKAAVRAVGGLGPNAEAALPQLRRLLQDRFPSIRAEAADAIQKIERRD